MSDVSTYELRALESRVTELERFHKEELDRRRRRDDFVTKLMVGILAAVLIIFWTVAITLAIVDKK